VALEILTVGHSRHPWPRFLALLQAGGVELVADVRSVPRSRFSPHFNRESMKGALESAGIAYEWLGRELGGRPPEAEFYDAAGHVRYDLLAATDRFRQGLERAKLLAAGARVALLCSEEDPNACHRHLLVGRALAAEGVMLRHLRGDGRVQSDVELASMPPGLFDT
jgi:uncharacterized protein (DUF488 family)